MSRKKRQLVEENIHEIPKPCRIQFKLDDLINLNPLTVNQQLFFNYYDKDNPCIILHGYPGTGKTFCAMYKALEDILTRETAPKKVVIVRSAVQCREIGHLPGGVDEKMDIYKQPYRDICASLFGRNDAYARLEEQKRIEFFSTSFMRGLTLDNTIIIADECQNYSFDELDTLISRMGHQTKIIFCGDYRQTDLNKKKNDKSGLLKFFDIIQYMKTFKFIEFSVNDICRSDIVKEYIIAKMKYEDNQ